jgi:hypothetical protein
MGGAARDAPHGFMGKVIRGKHAYHLSRLRDLL